MSGALKVYARANQGVVVSPFILGGAMGPVTQPALLAQAHVEAMAGIALAQLVRPGAPVVYGNFQTTMDLQAPARPPSARRRRTSRPSPSASCAGGWACRCAAAAT